MSVTLSVASLSLTSSHQSIWRLILNLWTCMTLTPFIVRKMLPITLVRQMCFNIQELMVTLCSVKCHSLLLAYILLHNHFQTDFVFRFIIIWHNAASLLDILFIYPFQLNQHHHLLQTFSSGELPNWKIDADIIRDGGILRSSYFSIGNFLILLLCVTFGLH